MDSKKIFFVGVIIAASGLVSPPLALLAGIVFGFSVAHPYRAESHSLAKFLLQASVIGLGFGMNLHEVIHAGRSGFVYTAISITFAIALGLLLGKWMKIAPKASFLITCGTAICGGSAIAALAPITDASEEDMAVSLGTVFTLNAVALLAFPLIGWWLHFTQDQFGLWAALAIHDTSSVVGAAAKYGPQALAVGTTVKLARALWIVPLSFATAMFTKSKAKVQFPWFILLFLLAAVASTYLPSFSSMYMPLNHLGKIGLTVTLFLIGTGLSRETFRQVGVRPMVQGVVLWVVVATLSLLAIRSHLIGI
ncbi:MULTISPECIES: YeiH family protein [Terriglobus]|uniref:YeiH family protein n=1 Tax=Terriglobus aquaticus TaxID=940139 RepID=A0ABW9KP92_9BACT|nr:putative sulfate exporter family transporter [Terriglobus roseus]